MSIVKLGYPLRPRYRAILNTKYNEKKIQSFVMNMTFISSRVVKKIYISFMASPLIKSFFFFSFFFHFTRSNKSPIHDPLYIHESFIFQIHQTSCS